MGGNAARKEIQPDEWFADTWVRGFNRVGALARREDCVKGPDSQKKAEPTEETGQKAGELLLAVLAELRASRKESEALRKLLETVLAALTKQEARSQEANEETAQERNEGSAGPSAPGTLKRATGPVAIQFLDPTHKPHRRVPG